MTAHLTVLSHWAEKRCTEESIETHRCFHTRVFASSHGFLGLSNVIYMCGNGELESCILQRAVKEGAPPRTLRGFLIQFLSFFPCDRFGLQRLK